MPNLNDWIKAQLKKGYSISQIKAVLNRKGYSPKAVAEVDKVRLSALPKKQNPHPKKIILAGLLIGAVLVAWFLALPFFSKQPSEKFCDKFKDVDYNISCGEAVNRALKNTPGIVQNISIGTINAPRISSDPSSGLIKRNAWLIDIKLQNPYFNEAVNKEVKIERTFIGLDEDFGLYKKPLG